MTEPPALRARFVHALCDSYDAEQQLTAALPAFAQAAYASPLRAAFEAHLFQTRLHVARLERVFEMLGETARSRRCAGVGGIVDEARAMIAESAQGPGLDAGLIGAARRIEQFESGAYQRLVTEAHALGHDDAAELLQDSLDEEETADKTLSELAERQPGGTDEGTTEAPVDEVVEAEIDPDGGTLGGSAAASA